MTEEEIVEAYKKIQDKKKEDERQRFYAKSIEYAKTLIDNPVTLEVSLTDPSMYTDMKYDDRDRYSYDLDELLDKLPAGCKVKVTIEVIQP